MAERKMNITVPIKYGRDNDKTFWHTIGTAFENEKGQITGYLNSLPIPGEDGKVKFMLFDKNKDDDHGSARSTRNGGSGSKSRKPASSKTRGDDDMDDEIPF